MEHKLIYKVSVISIVVNVLLSIFKLIAGILASSNAMISDAVHSASDVFSTIIVIIGVSLSKKKSDDNHRYGHERLECIAALLLAIVLGITGGAIGLNGLNKSIETVIQIPGKLALIAAITSIIVKEWMYWYTRAVAKTINSGALMADAWHHRSDSLSSIGALIGILGARLGYPVLDTVACVVISIFIEKAAFDIFKDAIDKMVDKSCSRDTIELMTLAIKNEKGVIEVDDIKTRLFGNKVYVDVEISADRKKSLEESHAIAEHVHKTIEREFPMVKHCMVHVNPYYEKCTAVGGE